MERVIEAVTVDIQTAAFDELPARTLYGILRLRAEVFVVEQACVYLDPDGRDHEPGALHCWVEADGAIVAALRILPAPGGSTIGRVVTAPHARSRGIGALLLRQAIDLAERPIAIHAQSQLVGWYEGFGFVPSGDPFLEDGIPHTPMVLR